MSGKVQEQVAVILPTERSVGYFGIGDEVLVYVPKGADPFGEHCFERGQVVGMNDGGALRVELKHARREFFQPDTPKILRLEEVAALRNDPEGLQRWFQQSKEAELSATERGAHAPSFETAESYVKAFEDWLSENGQD